MRAVVTGAAGFIGSKLTAALLAGGDEVVAVDRFSDYYDTGRKRRNLEPFAASDAFGLVEADLCEADLPPLLEGADVVFHLAAQPGARGGWGDDFATYLHDNVLATQRLLAALRESPSRLVLASSSSVYGEAEVHPTPESAELRPISPYGATKVAAERVSELYAREHAVDVVVLRYFTVFGPGQRPDMAISRFADAVLEDRPIDVFGDGRQARELTYVDDVVDATLRAAERGTAGSAYNIGGGVQTSVLELIDQIGALTERTPAVRHVAEAAGDMRRTGGDVARARAELGFEPRVGLREGLVRQLEAHLAARGAVFRVTELIE